MRRRLLHLIPLAVYLAGLGATIAVDGPPASGDRLPAWIVAGLTVLCVAAGRRWTSVLRDWLPFLLALWVYDILRSYADGRVLPPHAHPQYWVDLYVFGGGRTVPTVWLQRHLWNPAHLHWWDWASFVVYMSHFVAAPILMGILWWRSRRAFREFAAAFLTLSYLGFLTFFLYPAYPPWLASETHVLPPVTRLMGVIGKGTPHLDFRPLYERGVELGNAVAAMPSLHSAYALLISVFLWRRVPRWVRPLLAVYPPAMGFALVYGAEHYAIDVLAGWIYVWATLRLLAWVRRRRASAAVEPEPAAELEIAA